MQLPSLKNLVMESLADLKALDPVILKVTELTDVTDILVVVSGTSNRHVKALAEGVCLKAKEHGIKPLGVEGVSVGDWVLVDFGDLILHVMLPSTREFYSLESLWKDPEGRLVTD